MKNGLRLLLKKIRPKRPILRLSVEISVEKWPQLWQETSLDLVLLSNRAFTKF